MAPERSDRKECQQTDHQSKSQLRNDFLAELAAEIRDLVHPDEIMRTCASMLAEHIESDRCAYASVEDEAVFIITGDYCRGVPSIVGRWPVAAFGGECVRAMLANEPYVVDDVSCDPRAGADLGAYQATMIRSVICVPLHKAGKFTAAMAVHQTHARHWSEEEIELVRAVVARCWESLERARGNRQLEETSERLSLALSAAQLGDWSWDLATDIVTFSRRAAEIFGIPEGPHMTWSAMQELISEEDLQTTLRVLERAIACQGQYDAEYRVKRTDGSCVWVSSKGMIHCNEDGQSRMYGVVQDISRQKQLEDELRSHLAELAGAARKKDEFIALLAHELRNPLAPIRTGVEVIRRSADQPDVIARISDVMDRQLGHMVRLIDDLLDASRISRGKLTLRMEPLNLTDVIYEALESLLPRIEEAGLRVSVSAPAYPIAVKGDATRLTQVIGNLLANCAKFTDAGGSVSVRAGLVDGWAEVIVEDTGIGISEDILPHVFDMFVQAHPPGFSKGGLGIGLALVRSLIELHGGFVEVRSPGLGKGSSFKISIPELEDTTISRDDRVTEDVFSIPELDGATVLIADDSRDGAEALGQLIGMMGSKVHIVHDGAAALEAAGQLGPDLILMDIGMPQMDGFEAARQIRASDHGKAPLIFALTGWGRDEDRHRSHAAGMDGHLVKPVRIEHLKDLISSCKMGRH